MRSNSEIRGLSRPLEPMQMRSLIAAATGTALNYSVSPLHIKLFYVSAYFALLCIYTVHCCIVLHCTILSIDFVLYCIVLYGTVLYWTILYRTVLSRTEMHDCTALYPCNVLYCSVPFRKIHIDSTITYIGFYLQH